MGDKRASKIYSHISPESRDRLIRLGMIFSLDALLNNGERYPFIWDGDGNPDNILVKMKVDYTTKTS